MVRFEIFNANNPVIVDGDVIFCADDGIIRIGYLYEEYHGNGYRTYYFKSKGVLYIADGSLFCEVEIAN